ncbi:hypothetical protein ABEB36_015849 [Hypothenemus hampei]|uniref:Uncharacterized protein n=1 Tax=Hypothenemus hampei TaxID=57062 RepID=A0ABD1E0F4_HYPHA
MALAPGWIHHTTLTLTSRTRNVVKQERCRSSLMITRIGRWSLTAAQTRSRQAAEEDTGNTSGKTYIPGLAAKRFRGRPRHGTELGFERTRRTHPPSPRPGPARQPVPASSPSPTRPDPQSQSLSRSYGSNLPTSLTYIILSTRGSSPWRPAADMGTNWRDSSTWPSPGFSRSEGKIRTPRQLRCSSRSKPYLPARGFHGTRTLMQKRKLFPDLPTASPGLFGLPRRTLLRGPDF